MQKMKKNKKSGVALRLADGIANFPLYPHQVRAIVGLEGSVIASCAAMAVHTGVKVFAAAGEDTMARNVPPGVREVPITIPASLPASPGYLIGGLDVATGTRFTRVVRLRDGRTNGEVLIPTGINPNTPEGGKALSRLMAALRFSVSAEKLAYVGPEYTSALKALVKDLPSGLRRVVARGLTELTPAAPPTKGGVSVAAAFDFAAKAAESKPVEADPALTIALPAPTVEDPADKVLEALRRLYKDAPALFHNPTSGVALTPEKVADLAGDVIRLPADEFEARVARAEPGTQRLLASAKGYLEG